MNLLSQIRSIKIHVNWFEAKRKMQKYGAIIVKLYSSVHQISIKMRRMAEKSDYAKAL